MENNLELIEEKREKILELYEQIEFLEESLTEITDESIKTNLKVKIDILTNKQLTLLEEIRNLSPQS